MKKLFLMLLCAFPLIGMERIKELRAPSKLGDIDLRHDDNGLYIMKDGEAQLIERHQCNKLLRELIASKKIKEFQKVGHIEVNELDNEELIVRANVNGLKGGGLVGTWAGCVAGKFVVHFVAQVGIGIATAGVAVVCPPAAPAFFYAAEAAVTPTVEAVSNVVAIGTGILGGVATGPV